MFSFLFVTGNVQNCQMDQKSLSQTGGKIVFKGSFVVGGERDVMGLNFFRNCTLLATA